MKTQKKFFDLGHKDSDNSSLKRRSALFSLCMFMFVGGYAQTGSVNVQLNNASVKDMIGVIESQSNYRFSYRDAEVAGKNGITVSDNSISIKDLLTNELYKRNLKYVVSGNKIIITQVDEKQQSSQVVRISGTIVDVRGESVIGATVTEKGTTNGTITDLDGAFSLSVPSSAQVEISYVGYKTLLLKANAVKGRIVLREDTEVLEEVVVTALGIKRSEKALSYNVQKVESDALTTVKDPNFINSLSGKVAGVNINASSSGVGGVSKVVMRGTKSIMQSSNALYVIDGVPMFANNSKVQGTEFASQGNTEPIADINPEDIESMSVLTGAAAAALYGSDAANGAIIITTKKGKAGKVNITVNSNVEFNSPLTMPRFQTRYGSGINGIKDNNSSRSWGPKLSDQNYYGYDPASDYLQTGLLTTESVSFSTGNEKNQTYASAAAVNSKGIVPNNKYERYNFTVRNTTSFLNDKMTFDVNASYVMQKDRNMLNQGTYGNPLVGAYLFPRGNDWEDIKMYERYDPTRKIYTQYWPTGDAAMTMQNPYWVNYRNLRENNRNRYMLGASLNYKILDWLTVSGRVRIDHSTNDYTEKAYASTNTQLTEGSNRGLYGIERSNEQQLYADFLVSVNKQFGDDWSLQANLGGSFTDMRYDAISNRGPIADDTNAFAGEKPGLTNEFSVQNLSATKLKKLQQGWREQTQSIYASVEVGYKSTYYLSLTGRNDWPSQLAGPKSESRSFFYPSVGASIVLSELMPNLNKDYMSYWKIRGSFASVGNPFTRYIANPNFTWNSSIGQWSNLTDYPMYNLKPERTNSFEVGMNIRFLKNFDFDVTYYNAKTMNQTFNPELPVGEYARIFIQTGAVRNQGLELALNFNKTWKNFTWDTGLTYSMNKNKILTLADNAINPVTGERFSISLLNMGGLGSTRFILKEGGSMGDLYSLIDLKRDANDKIYIDEAGNVATQTLDANNYIKLGSVLPDGNLAWRNHFSWKNFDLSFLISTRLGGVVFSRTQAVMDNFGVSKASADARDLGYVPVNGNDRVNPEQWYNVVAGGTAVPQYYTYSATNVRLQEASIGYTIPRKWLGNVCDVKVALVGRNLWMIYNKAPFDPESVASTSNFYQGIDYFMMPALRNVGFNLSFKF